MTSFLTAVGLAIAIEGALYGLFPEAMKKFMLQVSEQSDMSIRWSGMTAAVLGVGLVWLVIE
jgi:uncharacterized protein YjeT (DUF2065 family)